MYVSTHPFIHPSTVSTSTSPCSLRDLTPRLSLSLVSHSRARGNLKDINHRRCLNLNVVGEGGPLEPSTGQERGRNGSEESGIDLLASPGSDGGSGGGDVLARFPPYQQGGNSGSSSPSLLSQQSQQSQPLENGYVYPPRQEASAGAVENGGMVYPPRQERGGGGGGGGGVYARPPGSMSPALDRHARQSSQSSSTFSTHSSRASHHSDGNNSGDSFPPVYRRSNSTNSNSTNNNNHLPPGSDTHQPGGYAGSSDEFLPPTDYDEDSFNQEPVAMRHKGFPPAGVAARRPASGPAPQGPGSPMLMRSMPASVLRSEMALQSPRSPRGGGRAAAAEGDEYFFNADRRSQPVYPSQSDVDFRPHSADYGGGAVRRVHSMYR